MSRPRVVLGLLLAALAFMAAQPALAAAHRPVVVELYTSQGCSSCPPADAFLSRLADRKDVLALSLPVTYWDMLGWKDTLASEGNTRRQKAYSMTMGRGGVYTPQVIVDGDDDIVGGHDSQIESAIALRESDLATVPIDLKATRGELHIVVGAGESTGNQNATIWLFHILSHATVSVGAGENSGHTLSYRNVVREVKAVGMWKGQPVSLDLPREPALPHDAVAVVVQQGGYGRIIGAAQLGHPDYASAW